MENPRSPDGAAGPEAGAAPARAVDSPNVTLIERDGRRIYLLGTAHISARSVQEVEALIEEVRPDTVCVELDQTRYEALVDESRWRKLDIFEVLRQRKVLFLIANLTLSAYQRRLGEQLGVEPGAELKAAVRKAEQIGARLVLADRDIQATLKRTWANLSFFKKISILGGLFESFFKKEELTSEQLEAMKDRDTISEMMAELAKVLPQIKTPLIDERDQYLMTSIEEAPGDTIVAVVGAGHVGGMLDHVGKRADKAALSVIPPPGRAGALAKWIIPGLILAAFALGLREGNGGSFLEMLRAWILPTAIGCGLFTAIAGGRPLTILGGTLAAPLTTLNPAIAAGMVTAPLEAWLRRPTVEDCERVRDDVRSLRGVYRNRFTRVLLVFLLSNIGAALGAWVGLGWVVSLV